MPGLTESGRVKLIGEVLHEREVYIQRIQSINIDKKEGRNEFRHIQKRLGQIQSVLDKHLKVEDFIVKS